MHIWIYGVVSVRPHPESNVASRYDSLICSECYYGSVPSRFGLSISFFGDPHLTSLNYRNSHLFAHKQFVILNARLSRGLNPETLNVPPKRLGSWLPSYETYFQDSTLPHNVSI